MVVLLATENQDCISNKNSYFHESTEIEIAANRLSSKEKFTSNQYDIVYLDISFLKSNTQNTLDSFKELKKSKPNQKIIILTENEDIRETMTLIKNGADDYLVYPISPIEIKTVTDQVLKLELKIEALKAGQDHFWQEDYKSMVETNSPKMQNVYSMIKDVAPTNSTILINGQTGVGKGVLARLIHSHSSRKGKQFIHVHCGAIPENLIESELFGHEKGAFTGAIKKKLGKFEIAHEGTIFLDEISTLSSLAQIKLLQVMQDSIFQRVGGESDIKVNVRIIAASNENLKELSEQGKFRSDLYYRLNVFPIELPSLNERIEDLPHIAGNIISKLNQMNLKSIDGIQTETLNALAQYDWPGNIRELENLLERAHILEKSNQLSHSSFPLDIFKPMDNQAILPLNLQLTLSEARNRNTELFEQEYLKELLTSTLGKINTAAEKAGISVRQLNNLMNKHQLQKEDFKNKK